MSQILVRPEEKLKPIFEQKVQIEIPQQEVKPQKLSEIVRSFTCQQIQYSLSDGKGGYCVLGAIFKYFGHDFATDSATNFRTGSHQFATEKYRELTRGLNVSLVRMNNSGKTFGEIADYLESIGL